MRTNLRLWSPTRPADILFPHGRPAALDVRIISPLQQQLVDVTQAASIPGRALEVGVQRKLSSHLSECRGVGVDFFPLVEETLGGLAKDSITLIHSIGKALGQRSNPLDPQTSNKHLFGRFALSLYVGV